MSAGPRRDQRLLSVAITIARTMAFTVESERARSPFAASVTPFLASAPTEKTPVRAASKRTAMPSVSNAIRPILIALKRSDADPVGAVKTFVSENEPAISRPASRWTYTSVPVT